jgi:hypothetical protein
VTRALASVATLLAAAAFAGCAARRAATALPPPGAAMPGAVEALAALPPDGVPVVSGVSCAARCACPPRRAFRATAQAEARVLFPSGDMRITLGGEPLTGTTVDLRDDLALDPTVAPRVTAAVEWGRHRVHGLWERFAFCGETTLDRDVVYHGRTFSAGERVDSEVSLEHGLLGWETRLLGRPRGALWAGVGAWVWRFDSRVESETTGIVEERGFSHAFPVATASGSFDAGFASVVGRATGGLLASDRFVVDADLGLERRFLRDRLAVRLAYAFHLLEFHETTNEATIVAHGPSLAVSFDF